MPYHSGWAEEAQGNRAASGALVIKGTRGEGRRCAENTNNLTLCRNPAVYGGLRGCARSARGGIQTTLPGPALNSGLLGDERPGKQPCMGRIFGNALQERSRREERVKTGGQPGNHWTGVLRRWLVRMIEGQPDVGCTVVRELIYCDCGGHPDLDYRRVSPGLQQIRRPFPAAAWVAAHETHVSLAASGRRCRRPACTRCQLPAEVLSRRQDSGRHPRSARQVAGEHPTGGPAP